MYEHSAHHNTAENSIGLLLKYADSKTNPCSPHSGQTVCLMTDILMIWRSSILLIDQSNSHSRRESKCVVETDFIGVLPPVEIDSLSLMLRLYHPVETRWSAIRESAV